MGKWLEYFLNKMHGKKEFTPILGDENDLQIIALFQLFVMKKKKLVDTLEIMNMKKALCMKHIFTKSTRRTAKFVSQWALSRLR